MTAPFTDTPKIGPTSTALLWPPIWPWAKWLMLASVHKSSALTANCTCTHRPMALSQRPRQSVPSMLQPSLPQARQVRICHPPTQWRRVIAAGSLKPAFNQWGLRPLLFALRGVYLKAKHGKPRRIRYIFPRSC